MLLGVSAFLAGCSFVALKEDLARLERAIFLAGRVDAVEEGLVVPPDELVVLVTEASEADIAQRSVVAWGRPAEVPFFSFVLEQDGAYSLAAFWDQNGNSALDRGERFGTWDGDRVVNYSAGTGVSGLRLTLDQVSIHEQLLAVDKAVSRSGFVPISFGKRADLGHERFGRDKGARGLWRPLEFSLDAGYGVWFVEEFDPDCTPVLFVYGAGGSPHDFQAFFDRLDRTRYQAWFYHYPSGMRLEDSARALHSTLEVLREVHGFDDLIVTAHSMGGLVARRAVFHQVDAGRTVARLITISTPWGGHGAARSGVQMAPASVPSWRDLQPGSPFLGRLAQRPLLGRVPHDVLFSYRGGAVSMLSNNDGSVSLASQLPQWVQDDSVFVRGFNETHEGVLESDTVLEVWQELLGDGP